MKTKQHQQGDTGVTKPVSASVTPADTTVATGVAQPDSGASGSDTTEKKLHLFQSGDAWRGNRSGRPKGSRNKLGEDFIQALQEDFQANGVAAIATVREERPHEYLKVIAGILPKELNVTTTTVEELSDDDLARGIAALQSALAQGPAEGSGPETKH